MCSHTEFRQYLHEAKQTARWVSARKFLTVEGSVYMDSMQNSNSDTAAESQEKCSVHPWLIFGPRQSIATELWGSEASDFNLGLNIQ